MDYSLFGRTGLRVSQLFLGAMIFGDDRGFGASPEEARRILDAYVEAGGNVIDTAVNYAGGRSEEVVGELLDGRRDSFVLATKYTVSLDSADPNAAGNSRKNLLRSLETSLRRLRTDRVDIYWVHAWDPHTPVEETMRALDDAVRAGKVLYVGISDAPAWLVAHASTLADWRGWSPFAAIQVPYSLVNRDVERELLPMADYLGLGVAAWSPLGGGLLTGRFSGARPAGTGTRLSASGIAERDLEVARRLDEVAGELGVSPAQVALAWTMTWSGAVHPIVGARSLEQLRDNLGSVDCVLPDDAVRRLDEAAPFVRGFPSDFLRSTASFVYGEAGQRVRPRRGPRGSLPFTGRS